MEYLELTLKVKEIILLRSISDEIILRIDAPSPFPNIEGQEAFLKMEVQRGTGEDYCLKVFGRTPDNLVDGVR